MDFLRKRRFRQIFYEITYIGQLSEPFRPKTSITIRISGVGINWCAITMTINLQEDQNDFI